MVGIFFWFLLRPYEKPWSRLSEALGMILRVCRQSPPQPSWPRRGSIVGHYSKWPLELELLLACQANFNVKLRAGKKVNYSKGTKHGKGLLLTTVPCLIIGILYRKYGI